MPSPEFITRYLRRAAARYADRRANPDAARAEGDAAAGGVESAGEAERRPLRKRVRTVLLGFSAAVAAFVCAALLFNYVIMPLVVRRGDVVFVPDLIGMPSIAAVRAADRAGLRSRFDTERPDPQAPVGSVVAQIPQGGSEVKRGRTVVLTLSSGIDLRRLPRLAGLNARQAQLDAEQAGFAIEDAVEVHSDHVERGRVIGTSPSGGAVLPAGTGITMMVSLGPRPTQMVMPSLVGRTPEEARLIAEGLGLVMRSVKYEGASNRSPRQVVVVQDPVAGSHVVAGDAVTLRIGD
jgi:beta-lactam-binding protein with PASTA domain